jgi:hypothetical protein
MDREDETNTGQPEPPQAAPAQEPHKVDPPPAAPATAQQFKEVEERMTAFERSTVRWTRVAVFAAILAAAFNCLQWLEIHEGGADTHNLAVAARDQAAAAKAQVEELTKEAADTHDLAVQAKNQADRTKTIAEQAIIQAKAALVQATAMATMAAEVRAINEPRMILVEGGWLKTYHQDSTKDSTKTILVSLLVANTGAKPADGITIAVNMKVGAPPKGKELIFKRNEVNDAYPAGPLTQSNRAIDPDHTTGVNWHKPIAASRGKRQTLYIWGEIRYTNLAGQSQPPVQFCRFVPVDAVLAIRSDSEVGYSGPYKHCDEKAN